MRSTEKESKDSRLATASTPSGMLPSLRRNQVLRDTAYFSFLPFQRESPSQAAHDGQGLTRAAPVGRAPTPVREGGQTRICWRGGPRPQATARNTRSAGVDGTPVRGARPQKVKESSQGTAAANPRIVVVDDEPLVRAFLKDLLTGKGYTVSVTADPKTGLRMLMGQKPDLVILGLKRSEMDSLDLLREMKTYDEMMPVIVTTHPVNIRLAKEGVRLGAFDYVLKPFDPAYMGALVENALEQWPAA